MTDRPTKHSEHERHADSVAAYLLGALPALEARAFERHLMSCERCREELEWLRPAAGALPHAVSQVTPPPSLKRSLMRSVRSEVAVSQPRKRGLLESVASRVAWPRPAIAVAAATAVLAVGVLAGVGTQSLLDQERSATYSASASAAVPRARGRLQVLEGGGSAAVVRLAGLPRRPSGVQPGVYQLWLVRGDADPAPSSTFSVGADRTGTVAITEDLNGVDAVLVTREPPGGSETPSEEPIVSFDLS